jgi:Domain of unknown function (DUF4105)
VARLLIALGWLFVALVTLWSAAALYFDFPFERVRIPAAIFYLLCAAAVIFTFKPQPRALFACGALFLGVLAWWLTLKPSNDKNWYPDVAQTAWAEIQGDQVTLHNFRNCEYRSQTDYSCRWETKTLELSKLRGVDVSFVDWGLPCIAHIIVSFEFGDEDYVAVSIETRKQIDQHYSAMRGFFRTYTLIYLFSDERDVLRLRTNFRHNEEVYLYRTTATPEWSRALFLEYLGRANQLRDQPEWYNALTHNCTTNVFTEMARTKHLPRGSSRLDPRILFSGLADKMLYNGGNFAGGSRAGGLPFLELKRRAHINASARAASYEGFSREIRIGRPGFESLLPKK